MSLSISQAIAEQQQREKHIRESRYRLLNERANRGLASRSELRELQRLKRQGCAALCSSAFPSFNN